MRTAGKRVAALPAVIVPAAALARRADGPVAYFR